MSETTDKCRVCLCRAVLLEGGIMPVYLEPENDYSPQGPDGRGRNRLRIELLSASPQCAIRPLLITKLKEAMDTRLAQHGYFGRCDHGGQCETCPRLKRRTTLESFGNQVLFREDPEDPSIVWAMNKPEDGWASSGYRWKLEDIAVLEGWRLGRLFRDEHSFGFWMVRD